MKLRLLLIEDEPEIRRFTRNALEKADFAVDEADSLLTATHALNHAKPDLILLDLGLPDGDGLQLIDRIRNWSSTPILVLSARSQEQQKVDALHAGADDFLVKPFGIAEMVARVQALLRRHHKQAGDETPIVRFGDVEVDFSRHLVVKQGVAVHLTAIEFKLLGVLIRQAGKVVTQSALMQQVWGNSQQDNSHYLRIYISRLRKKLENDPSRPVYLLNELGVGYRFKN
jgi:two-component system KDP operon response regulator KdpE